MKKWLKKLFVECPIYIPIAKYHYYFAKKEFKNLLTQCENWDIEQVREWQLRKVQQVVDFAFENVPFYNQLYKSVGYKTGDITCWEDFERLPLVSKSDIKTNLELFTAPQIAQLNAHRCHTGGSTDKPMEFFLDKATEVRELAFFEYYWSKNGYTFGEKCVVLRGHQVANPARATYTQKDNTQHYLVCDSRYLSDADAVKSMVYDIKRFDARVLQAYPSSAYFFAKAIVALGIEPPHFEYIFLGSENTYEDQIDFIKQVFSANDVLYHYGHSECAGIAIKYPERKEMGFCPVYGITEFITPENYSTDARTKEIVTTGWNLSTPFIRYKTGDYAIVSDYTSNDYLKCYKSVERIEGRMHEYLVTKDLRKISLCNIAGAHIPSLSLVGDMQYEQDSIGAVTIYVTPPYEGATLNTDLLSQIQNDYDKIFASTMDVTIKVVEQLRKSPIGKKILLIQHLDLQKF